MRKNAFTAVLFVAVFSLGLSVAANAEYYHKGYDLNTQGVTSYRAKNYQRAVQLFQEAIALAPQNPVFHNNLGLAFDSLGRTNDAIEEYRIALRISPNYVDALNNIGVAFYKQAMYVDARKVWERALEIEPRNREIRANYELVMARIVEMPAPHELAYNPSRIFEEGKSLYLQRRYEEAMAAFREVLGIKPSSAMSHYYMGLCYRAIGAERDALISFLTSLDFDSRNAWAHYHIAQIYNDMGMIQRAKNYMKRALTLDPELALLKGI